MQKFGTGEAGVNPEDSQGIAHTSSIFNQGAAEETPEQVQQALDQENIAADAAAPEMTED